MAGGISDEDIQRVREASDIVALFAERVQVKQRGRDFWCCCPFHDEKTPSCKIDPSTQLWHCFGCGEGGDAFTFVEKAEGVDFPDAVRSLAERAHIELHEGAARGAQGSGKARLRDVCAKTAAFYHTQLMRSPDSGAAAARSYLASRGLGGDVPRTWNLGFAPGSSKLVRHLGALGFSPAEMLEANVAVNGRDGRLHDRFFNRVMFPINDPQGAPIAFGGRVIGASEGAKYINTQETPLFHKSKVLYGLDRAKASMTATGSAVICEGYTDVIALHEAGVENAVATLGTALTAQHIRLLSRFARKRIVYLFDGDAAGQRAADRALLFIDGSITPEASKSPIELFAVTLPDDLDPAEFVAARGGQALKDLIDEATPLLRYGIERRIARHDTSVPEGRAAALADALSVLAPIKDSVLAKEYAVQAAGMLRVREDDALAQLAALAVPRRQEGREGEQAPARPPVRANLAEPEANRRRIERQFLAVCAQNPPLALEHAADLSRTQWHDRLCEQLAAGMLDVLEKDPAASAAQVVGAVSARVPQAAPVLAALARPAGQDDAALARYLAEELSIGDMEDEVAAFGEKLRHADGMDPEEADAMFEAVVGLQRQLVHLRKSHSLRS